jgi:two-component system CheB/CheR fusion protein
LWILVVDDHEDTLEGTSIALRFCGAKVLIASDARSALEIARSTKPDVILCDLRMPGMDGFEFIARLHSEPLMRRVPVVAMSGLGSPQDRLRTQDAGFAGHLVKPIDLANLAGEFRRVLAQEASPCQPTQPL